MFFCCFKHKGNKSLKCEKIILVILNIRVENFDESLINQYESQSIRIGTKTLSLIFNFKK